MAKESTQHKLDRVRSPRVHITYDVEIGDAIELKELPPEPEIAFGPDVLPAGAAKIAWPRTTPPRPQSETP